MGDNLSKPITEKHTSTFETPLMRVGCCGMQGWRKNMEDAHVAHLNLAGVRRNGLFGVFDGHNGYITAKYCGAHMADELLSSPEFEAKNYSTAFEMTFLRIDEKLMRAPEMRHEGGCTAVCVLIADGQVVCANAGDSRAVMYRNGKSFALSEDHKPTLPAEIARIEKAGSKVQNGRVNQVLSLSRAIGDFDFKENPSLPFKDQAITAFPDVTVSRLSREDAFIVLACDGVWDVLSNEDCCSLVAKTLRDTNNDVGLVCEAILDKCLAPAAPGLGCDNMTIIVVQFKPAYFEGN